MRILSYFCAGLMGAAITIGVSAAAADAAHSGNRSAPTAQVQAPRQMGQVGAQRETTLPDSTLSGAPGWTFPWGATNRVTLPTCQDRNASNFGQIGSCVYPMPTCQDRNASNFGQIGSCVYPTPTCQDRNASNFGQIGSCVYPQCTGGRVWNGAACACPSGTTWDGSSCDLPPSCPAGQVWNGTQCIEEPPPSCPAGQVWNGRSCEEEVGHCGMPRNWGPNADPSCSPVQGGWRCWRSGLGWTQYACP